MWEEWVKEIKRKLGITDGPEWQTMPRPKGTWTPDSTQAVINSPFADSVQKVTGKPRHILPSLPWYDKLQLATDDVFSGQPIGTSMRDTGGLYTPNTGAVSMNMGDLGSRSGTEEVLSHELAHHLYYSDKSEPKRFEKAIAGRKPVNWEYASKNKQEHYAEAFANALDIIRSGDQTLRTSTYPKAQIDRAFMLETDAMDKRIPGTKYMIQKLITTDPYKDTLFAKYLRGELELKQ